MIYEITGETYRTGSDIEFCFKKNEEIHFFSSYRFTSNNKF